MAERPLDRFAGGGQYPLATPSNRSLPEVIVVRERCDNISRGKIPEGNPNIGTAS